MISISQNRTISILSGSKKNISSNSEDIERFDKKYLSESLPAIMNFTQTNSYLFTMVIIHSLFNRLELNNALQVCLESFLGLCLISTINQRANKIEFKTPYDMITEEILRKNLDLSMFVESINSNNLSSNDLEYGTTVEFQLKSINLPFTHLLIPYNSLLILFPLGLFLTKEILKIAEEDSLWTIPIGPKSRFCETFSQQTFFNQSYNATNYTVYNEFEICDSDLKYSSLSTIYASVFFMLLSKVIYGCLYENKEKLDDYEDGYVNTLIPNSNINMMRFIVSGAFYALFNGFNIFVDAEIEYASGVDPRIRYWFFGTLYCYYFDKVVINGVDRPISVKDMDEQERSDSTSSLCLKSKSYKSAILPYDYTFADRFPFLEVGNHHPRDNNDTLRCLFRRLLFANFLIAICVSEYLIHNDINDYEKATNICLIVTLTSFILTYFIDNNLNDFFNTKHFVDDTQVNIYFNEDENYLGDIETNANRPLISPSSYSSLSGLEI